MGNPGCFPRGKPAATEIALPTTYDACWVFSCFHNPPNSDMDYRIFNVRAEWLGDKLKFVFSPDIVLCG